VGDQYIGEIRMFAGNFAPVDWALCDGRLLSISEYSALFALIGTTYGGDGVSTFALPNLQGRIPIHAGSGPGLSPRQLGEMAGAETVTLTSSTMPQHTHDFMASTETAAATDPTGNVLAAPPGISLYIKEAPARPLSQDAIGPSPGGGQPHENMQPYLCVSFIIALQGIFPPRS
jgi:microcystin-dependent protein